MLLPVYPSTSRNRNPILSILKKHLPYKGKVLETASATGEHIVFFAEKFPDLQWYPSDKSDKYFWAVKKRGDSLHNVQKPICVDLTSISRVELKPEFNAVLNINMIHISPWEACRGLFKLSSTVVIKNGLIFLYGPFKEKNKKLASTNIDFDTQLQSQNPNWGIRLLDDVVTVAEEFGFILLEKYQMPSNNLSIVFQKST